ncbi:MAG: potassium-transporting ATPase subunit C, partial [Micrococcales bacterium]|nr:potassium-transporting ATPase subunit C [Micrococcales bacterium]
QRVAWWAQFNQQYDPANTAPIPEDLVTASGSGVDPYISPTAADYQVNRIAAARDMTPDAVRAVIAKYTTHRFLWFLGEPGVNVLEVNLGLDGLI